MTATWVGSATLFLQGSHAHSSVLVVSQRTVPTVQNDLFIEESSDSDDENDDKWKVTRSYVVIAYKLFSN